MGVKLSKEHLENIKTYKYDTNAATFFDGVFDPWWNFVVNCTPKWVAPNLLTCLGIVVPILAFCYTLYYDCTLGEDDALPVHVMLFNGFAIFWY